MIHLFLLFFSKGVRFLARFFFFKGEGGAVFGAASKISDFASEIPDLASKISDFAPKISNIYIYIYIYIYIHY